MPRKHPKRPPGKVRRRRPESLLDAASWGVREPANKDELRVARVLVNFGVESGVLLDGEERRLVNRRHIPVVAGDYVYTDGEVVEGVKPRGKVLARYAEEAGVRLVAANLDQVGVVCSASLPPLQEGFLDRYLVYCRIVDLPLFIVLNKMDEASEGVAERLDAYRGAGVDVYGTSALQGTGLEELERRLRRGDTILSGLSGAGKSSLLNTLLGLDLPVQEISTATGKGKHTTTTVEAFPLGRHLVIDSPGIKLFGLAGVPPEDVVKGFPEFEPLVEECRFPDCRHLEEEGCAVRAAAEVGRISLLRYEHYCMLLRSLSEKV